MSSRTQLIGESLDVSVFKDSYDAALAAYRKLKAIDSMVLYHELSASEKQISLKARTIFDKVIDEVHGVQLGTSKRLTGPSLASMAAFEVAKKFCK